MVSAIKEKHGWTAQPLERCGFDAAFPSLRFEFRAMGKLRQSRSVPKGASSGQNDDQRSNS
jgi:hypothetical protein